MNEVYQQIVGILERYLSTLNARSLIENALREEKLVNGNLSRRELPRITPRLRRGIELFVKPELRGDALRDLGRFVAVHAVKPEPCAIPIQAETDISRARSEARRLCEESATSGFTMQKITTIVSELARNIVSYTRGGRVELVPPTERHRRMLVRAIDWGPGIEDLDKILAGQYESKTGLGRGLVGTKRLSDRFDISTGPEGTRIEAEVNL